MIRILPWNEPTLYERAMQRVLFWRVAFNGFVSRFAVTERLQVPHRERPIPEIIALATGYSSASYVCCTTTGA